MSKIIIINYGSQYAQLIARRIREMNVYTEIISDVEKCKEDKDIAGFILSGGPGSGNGNMKIEQWILDMNVPILGICYGMQIMATHFGGDVLDAENSEFGRTRINICSDSILYPNRYHIDVIMSHHDVVKSVPEGFSITAQSAINNNIVSMENSKKKYYAVQFHPEVSQTEYGKELLYNFLTVTHVTRKWKCEQIIADIKELIHSDIGEDHVLIAVSGGVDSTVLATLLHSVLRERLHCVFVDNGLLRKGELAEVTSIFKSLNIPLTVLSEGKYFLDRLKSITSPEEKRKIIGNAFIDVFTSYSKTMKWGEDVGKGKLRWLAQGTIYPDVIESGHETRSDVIKSHHNVGGLPENMGFKLFEPFRMLFKDEIRRVGEELGISKSILGRHPSPGPSLAIRILSDVTPQKLHMVSEADHIFINMLKQEGYYDKISQAFAALFPTRAVSVMGDRRVYGHIIALRAVLSDDFMTASAAHLPIEFLERVSNSIINNVPGVSRCVYDVTSKPPGTIEYL